MNTQEHASGAGSGSVSSRLVPLVFTGQGGEYFRIWIVNLLLSILTLGIYSAWAKVRRLQYFHRNTHLAGSAFDYHARPIAILVGRLIAIAALLVYSLVNEFRPVAAFGLVLAYGLLMPLIVHRALRFRLHNTSWRGIRFVFAGTVRQAYRELMGPMIAWLLVLAGGFALAWLAQARWLMAVMAPVAVLGTYALVPLLHHRLKNYHHGNARLGALEGRFLARPGQFYGVYLRTLGLAIAGLIGAVVLIAVVLAMAGGGLGVLGNAFDLSNPLEASAAAIGMLILVFAGLWVAMSVLKPYFQARLQNLIWNRTQLGEHRFASSVGMLRLWAISVSNFVLIIASFGLFLPFAAIRIARYRLGSVQCAVLADLDRIVAGERERVTALGEEAADLFDIDIGL